MYLITPQFTNLEQHLTGSSHFDHASHLPALVILWIEIVKRRSGDLAYGASVELVLLSEPQEILWSKLRAPPIKNRW